MDIYILSGLGADERVFKSIRFGDNQIHFIKWIQPIPKESIEEYSKRLLSQIHSHRPVLIGLSFGGMMAVEIAKHIETEKVILISSAKSGKEIPIYYRVMRLLQIHKIVPAAILKRSNFLTNWFFGVKSTEDRKLLKAILAETDSVFLKWAIDKIVNWKNLLAPKNVIHIHGGADRVLPIQFVNCDFEINDGGHLMILNKAEEISSLLKRLL